MCLICKDRSTSTEINIKNNYCSCCIINIQMNINTNNISNLVKQNNIEIYKFLDLVGYNFNNEINVLALFYNNDIECLRFIHSKNPYPKNMYPEENLG